MAVFAITCVREVKETQTLKLEADTLAEALQSAALAYTTGSEGPIYDWDDCGIVVTELGFTVKDAAGETLISDIGLEEAEEMDAEQLEAYGVSA